MNGRPIDILEFPIHLGLRKKAGEIEPGVRHLPGWLRSFGLHERLHSATVAELLPPDYTMKQEGEPPMLHVPEIAQYALQQAELLGEQLERQPEHLALLLGGDCSILIGTMLALKQRGRYGLFFVDGHTDYIPPSLSTTGGVAGMDLAIVAGMGDERLAHLHGQQPYVEQSHIYCVGNREYDESYVRPVLESDVHYVDLQAVRQQGMAVVAQNFLDQVESEQLDGFWIHLDVDVLHHDLMPAVDSPADDGLYYEELTALLQPLLNSEKVAGMELAILDPSLDVDGTYTRPFVQWLVDILS